MGSGKAVNDFTSCCAKNSPLLGQLNPRSGGINSFEEGLEDVGQWCRGFGDAVGFGDAAGVLWKDSKIT